MRFDIILDQTGFTKFIFIFKLWYSIINGCLINGSRFLLDFWICFCFLTLLSFSCCLIPLSDYSLYVLVHMLFSMINIICIQIQKKKIIYCPRQNTRLTNSLINTSLDKMFFSPIHILINHWIIKKKNRNEILFFGFQIRWNQTQSMLILDEFL